MSKLNIKPEPQRTLLVFSLLLLLHPPTPLKSLLPQNGQRREACRMGERQNIPCLSL